MRIAVVGSGISGMLVARLLQRAHHVRLFEASGRLGGHAHTHDVAAYGGLFSVDTGFMVFNRRTYPNFVRLLEHLGVEAQPSDMSFSVHVERTGLEYNGSSLNTLFAQRRNLLRPSFYRMLRDVLRFGNEARAVETVDCPLGEFLDQRRYSREFCEHYLLPMAAAIWSCPPARVRVFPLRFLTRFFENHGLLDVRNRPQWYTVAGTSRRYVEALMGPLQDCVRLNSPIERISRQADGVCLSVRGGETERFDAVVLATHSDTALAMLADPTPVEREVLSALEYQPNEAVLHTDARLLPRCRRAWASWNAHVFDDLQRPAAVTYYLNRLQRLPAKGPICVTLGNSDQIDPSRVLRRMVYQHPVYSHAALAAQRRWSEISGVQRTYYCGAYWGNGFHEDGVNSALQVAEQFGQEAEWLRTAAGDWGQRTGDKTLCEPVGTPGPGSAR